MNELTTLLETSEVDRNFAWDEKFFKLFVDQNVRLLSKDPQQGPDGWPYLISETLNNNTAHDLDDIESVQKVLFWLAQKGVGLVVNPRRNPYPDYVFSYGMVWSFRETGFFMRPDLSNQSGSVTYENNKIISGAPTEQFLPIYVRRILKEFFRDQSVLEPKVLMVSTDEKNYDLCFSLESLGNPPEKEHAGIAEAIAWFLPPHYSIVLVSQQGLPPFISL